MSGSLKKFKREKRFSHIFNYQKEMIDFLRNLRISQRPLLSLIERIFADLLKVYPAGGSFSFYDDQNQSFSFHGLKVRSIGGKAGLVFPVGESFSFYDDQNQSFFFPRSKWPTH